MPFLSVLEAKERGRVNRDQHPKAASEIERRAAVALDGDRASDHALRRGRSESDDELRPYRLDFAGEPPFANLDLAGVRALVQPALAARLKFEMLDRVGHVDSPPIDAGILERLIQELARRADERTAGKILPVPRLLADQHDLPVRRPLPEHGLSRILP
jgi:hypothetical protein